MEHYASESGAARKTICHIYKADIDVSNIESFKHSKKLKFVIKLFCIGITDPYDYI